MYSVSLEESRHEAHSAAALHSDSDTTSAQALTRELMRAAIRSPIE